ncbi:hypothetical protein [Actinoplanes sp. CA-252034]|uniref:hypothetical protein n=1 Tax=Actinoplanes sp. CA-252034 TaxID=3239906 RepID=UPI003D95DB35
MGNGDDLRLLRAYEPVARFTEGEYFFPVSVERYVSHASLWRHEPGQGPVQIVAPGDLSLDGLAAAGGAEQGLGYALSGIGTGDKHLTHIPLRDRPPHLSRSSRLGAVGLTGRMVDTLNRFSLLFRAACPVVRRLVRSCCSAIISRRRSPPTTGGWSGTGRGSSASTGSSTTSTTGGRRSAGSTSTRPTGSR